MVCPSFRPSARDMHSTLFLLVALQKWQLGFWVFLYLVHNLPQLPTHTATSSPL